MPTKRYKAEEIIGKIRYARALHDSPHGILR